ncbi:MAG: class II glutamine amidotransferase [Sandaracinaceae bacterium]|nr:class II glutamine amidotransferase [Sandaracinaceae bacterium]
MARLVAYVANRTDRLLDALREERAAVGEVPSESADAWGIGFYQSGEVLHKKRPHRGGDAVSWQDIVGNVKTDCAVIHLRKASVGDYRSENTHPFRMRQWLFAHHGTVHGFDAIRDALVETLPDFLRRNVRGTTDSELVFHTFLSFLHDRGVLDAPDADPKLFMSAIRSTLALVDRLVSEIGAPEAELDMVISNGRSTTVVSRGAPMFFVERDLATEARGPAGPGFRYVLAYAGDAAPPDYARIARGSALWIERDLSTRTFSL